MRKNKVINYICSNCRRGDTEHCLKTEKRIMGNSKGEIENITIICTSNRRLKVMNIMKYPQKFINDVKRMFPENKDLHKALDNGDVTATGMYLLPMETEILNIVSEWTKLYSKMLKTKS